MSNWSPSSIPSRPGIDIYRGGGQSTGLLPGLKRGTDSIDSRVRARAKENRSPARDTMRIEPLGSRNVTIVGVVRERSQPDLNRRYGFGVGSIGFGELARMVGDPDPIQLTVLVDELSVDPAAIDFSGYTFLCPKSIIDKSVRQGAVVQATLRPLEILGGDRVWLASSIEVLH